VKLGLHTVYVAMTHLRSPYRQTTDGRTTDTGNTALCTMVASCSKKSILVLKGRRMVRSPLSPPPRSYANDRTSAVSPIARVASVIRRRRTPKTTTVPLFAPINEPMNGRLSEPVSILYSFLTAHEHIESRLVLYETGDYTPYTRWQPIINDDLTSRLYLYLF